MVSNHYSAVFTDTLTLSQYLLYLYFLFIIFFTTEFIFRSMFLGS